MNILYVGFFSLPDHDAAANRVLNNAKALKSCGHNVIFIDEQKKYAYSDFQHSRHLIQGFETWSLKRPNRIAPYLKKMLTCDYVETVFSFYDNIDLVIAYNYPAIALEKLRRYCKKRNVFITADCTEWYSGKEYAFPMNILSAVDSFYRMRIVHKKLDGLIVISSFLKKYYARKTTVLCPPLVDVEEEKWKVGSCIGDESKINLIYSGNPGKNKENLFQILELLSSICNREQFVFRIVGIDANRFEELYPESKHLLSGENLSVVFYGKVPHTDSLRLIKSSDFLIFLREPNRVNQAGFSTKFVEAITLGTKVITTNTGDLKKYVEENQSGYIVESLDELKCVLEEIVPYSFRNNNKINNKEFDYHNYILSLNDWVSRIKGEGTEYPVKNPK